MNGVADELLGFDRAGFSAMAASARIAAVKPSSGIITIREQRITDDLERLLAVLPDPLRQLLAAPRMRRDLLEVVLDLGRIPEARYPGFCADLGETPLSREDLDAVIARVGSFGGDNRAGIGQTLHRISAIRNRAGDVVGLTCRVGRSVSGTVAVVRDLVESGRSLLIMGCPGVGKTTVLREIARVLADELARRVVVIDTSNEIAGDGDVPHPAIGRARRMQVARPALQHRVMIEAVENHMPEVIVIDEIGSQQEAWAARTIAERGVQLVATAHGNELANLMKNPSLCDLIGGLQAVTLGDEEARRRRSRKTVQERRSAPTFPLAVEMRSRDRWHVHRDVAHTVDTLLREQPVKPEVRHIDNQGVLHIQDPSPRQLQQRPDEPRSRPLPLPPPLPVPLLQKGNGPRPLLHVFPCGVAPQQLEHLVLQLKLPVAVVAHLDGADAILSLRNHLGRHPGLRRSARALGVPIHVIKAASQPQLERALERLLLRFGGQVNSDEPGSRIPQSQC